MPNLAASEGSSITALYGNSFVNINIEDNGPGISEKDYQKALKPFQRLDSSRNQNIAGSGLGLSISQDIIKTLDGNLNLSKSEMGGLKVEINLPKIS